MIGIIILFIYLFDNNSKTIKINCFKDYIEYLIIIKVIMFFFFEIWFKIFIEIWDIDGKSIYESKKKKKTRNYVKVLKYEMPTIVYEKVRDKLVVYFNLNLNNILIGNQQNLILIELETFSLKILWCIRNKSFWLYVLM